MGGGPIAKPIDLLPAGFELEPGERCPNERQIRFAFEYAHTADRMLAAKKAGYAHPRNSGWQQTTKYPVVRRLIAFIRLRVEKQANVDSAWLLTEMATVAKANILDFVSIDPETGHLAMDPRTWHRQDAKAIERIKITNHYAPSGIQTSQDVEIRMVPKATIYDKIGKHVSVGAFKEDILRERGNEIAERLARSAERLARYHSGVDPTEIDVVSVDKDGNVSFGESDDDEGEDEGVTGASVEHIQQPV